MTVTFVYSTNSIGNERYTYMGAVLKLNTYNYIFVRMYMTL